MNKRLLIFSWLIIVGALRTDSPVTSAKNHVTARSFTGYLRQPFTELLHIEYHQQENSFFCGPASAQMILRFFGLPYSAITCENTRGCFNRKELCQTCIYDLSGRARTSERGAEWFSFPDALTNTINDYLPDSVKENFQYILNSETDGSRYLAKIINTLIKYRKPLIACVDSIKHWIVISGVDVTSDPVIDNPFEYLKYFNGFWVNDPSPQLGAREPLLHSLNDGCGDPGTETIGLGIKNEHIGKDIWVRRYQIPIDMGKWAGTYLTIADNDILPPGVTVITKKKPPFDGSRIITKKQAARLAESFLVKEGLNKKEFIPSLKNLKPATPLLVNCLDDPKDAYYIVPFHNSAKKTVALLSIDAFTGIYRQSAFPAKNDYLQELKLHTAEAVSNTFKMKMDSVIGGADTSAKQVFVKETLVWKPEPGLVSPFYPFQEVSYGNYIFYIRLNGKTVNALRAKNNYN